MEQHRLSLGAVWVLGPWPVRGESAEDLEKYETKMELQLYRKYRDVVGLFTHVVETERRFYLTNQENVKVVTFKAAGSKHLAGTIPPALSTVGTISPIHPQPAEWSGAHPSAAGTVGCGGGDK
jgi:hypothetical protein